MLFELGLPPFNTVIHNSKVGFANRMSVCDNAAVRCVLQFTLLLDVYLSLSVCVHAFFYFFCVGLVYGP